MFDEELVKKSKALEERWRRHVEERYRGVEFAATTASGISVKPMYSAADVADKDYEDIGVPGEYPYTRGIYPLHYQFQPWMNQLVHGYGLPEQTRERMDLLSREGMRGYFGGGVYNLVYDLVSQAGYDPDHPEARGRVGQCGVSVATVKDMELLFRGLPLDKSNVVHIIGEPTMAILAMFIVAGERMGYAKDKLRGNTMNYLFRQWHWDTIAFPPQNSFKLMVQLVKYCTREMPQWNTTNFAGYNMEEAGATAVRGPPSGAIGGVPAPAFGAKLSGLICSLLFHQEKQESRPSPQFPYPPLPASCRMGLHHENPSNPAL